LAEYPEDVLSEKQEFIHINLDNAKKYQKDDYYTVNISCLNCDFKGLVEIRKGHLVKNEACPKCECRLGRL
jgi:hypothetical protein